MPGRNGRRLPRLPKHLTGFLRLARSAQGCAEGAKDLRAVGIEAGCLTELDSTFFGRFLGKLNPVLEPEFDVARAEVGGALVMLQRACRVAHLQENFGQVVMSAGDVR